MQLFDFSTERSVDEWVPKNDVVMGGVSTGHLSSTGEGTVQFTGRVSLDNNGGFASVRSRPQNLDLRGYSGLDLRIRGDGQRYKINLKTDRQADGILYRARFETRQGEWQTLLLPFDVLEPTFRGRIVPQAPPLDLTRVTSVGLMISDGQAGPFRLELARIGAYEVK